MTKYFKLALLSILFPILSISQTVEILNEDFEGPTNVWSTTGNSGSNQWIINTCAGNGPTAAGSNSVYITKGGADVGCGTTGDIQYRYSDAAAGSEFTIVFTTVNASCLENLQFNIDYKLIGEGYNGTAGPFHDFGQIVYSTDGGTIWTNATNQFYNIPVWDNITLPLPAILNGQSFEFGIMWTFDNSLINDPPLSIDNITITGEDNTPPVATCPGDLSIPANNLCQTTLLDYSSSVVVSDICTSTPNITITQSPSAGASLDLVANPHNISYLVEDENGNSTTCSFNITVIDTTIPNVSCPVNQQVYLDQNCDYSLTDFSPLLTITDNCSLLANTTIAQNPIIGTVISNHGTIQNITIQVTDEGGNSNSCSFDIELIDTISPNLICPNDTNIFANNACESTIPNYTGVVVKTDNCSSSGLITLLQAPVAGGILSGLNASQLITITGTDVVGNNSQCTFTVNLIDTISPLVTCPVTQSTNGDSNCSATVLDYSAMVVNSDNCSNTLNLTYSQSPAIGNTVTGPLNTITITIQDESGNSSTCDFELQIIDVLPPLVTCPPNQNLFLNGNCESVLPDFSGTTIVTDNCLLNSQIIISQNPLPGNLLAGSLGSAIITMTASDTSSNSDQCQFTITLIDTVSPTISCPIDSTVYVDVSCEYTVADYTSGATVSDNCSTVGNIVITQDISPGTILNTGNQSILLTATDEAGNTNTCSFNLLVVDTISPTFSTCPANLDVEVDANCQATLIDYVNQTVAIDNCSGTLTFNQTPVPGTVISANSNVAIEVIDVSGNSSFCIIRVNLNDTIVPTIIICPSDQIVSVNNVCEYTIPDYTGFVSASDNCTPNASLLISQVPAAGTTMTGNAIVTISVKDQNSNSSSCSFNILVNDNTPPIITTCVLDQTEYVDGNCEHVLADYISSIVATDACGPVTISQSPPLGTVLNVGTTIIYMIAADSSGNLDSCQFDMMILDTISPIVSCISNFETCDTIVTFSDPSFSDNCGTPVLTRTDATGLNTGDVFPIGITTISYQVDDNSSNMTTCSFDVTVYAVPDVSVAGIDIDLCETDSTLLGANIPVVGIGDWSIISGSGNLSNSNSATSMLRNLTYGETVLTWQINNQICIGNIDTIRVNRYQNPSIALVSDTIQACGDTTTLTGNLPSVGTGTWTNIFGAGTISQPNSNQTFVSDLFSGENRFVWTISNGTCISTADTLVILSNDAPSIIDAGGSQNLCDTTDQINLVALQPDFGNGIWTVIEGNGIIDYDTSLSVIVSNIDGNPNTITWTVSKQYCPDQIDTIDINYYACIPFDPDIPTAFTPDGDGINDTWIIPDLNKFYPDCKVVVVDRWGNKVFESDGYIEPWDGRYKGEILPFSSYFFVIDFNTGSDKALSGSITIIK